MFLNPFSCCDRPGRGHWAPSPAIPLSCPLCILSLPFCRRFFCLFRFFLFVLHSYGESATENWQAVIVSCFPETVHYDPWATSRLEGCRNLCCCVSMHVAVKLVWEQRKLVHGSRVKWAVFCLAYYAFVIFRNRLDSSKWKQSESFQLWMKLRRAVTTPRQFGWLDVLTLGMDE